MEYLTDIFRSPFFWGSLYGIAVTLIAQRLWHEVGWRLKRDRTEARLREGVDCKQHLHWWVQLCPPKPWNPGLFEKWDAEDRQQKTGAPSSAQPSSPGPVDGHSP